MRNIFQIEKLFFVIKTHIYLCVRTFVPFNVVTVVIGDMKTPNIIQPKISKERGNRDGFLKVLTHLYQRLRGYTIWLYVDCACWHKGEPVKEFLKKHPRLRIKYLPTCQPALNMQERIWRRIRYEATTNRWFEDIDTIWDTIQKTANLWTVHKLDDVVTSVNAFVLINKDLRSS